ncbi:MAG: carbohydrate-binding family 9-like protein [Tepidisphaeraceae bacterium]
MAAISPRLYACGRTDHAISITGRGDDLAWQGAAWTEDFVDIQGIARPMPRFKTRAKMLWDDQYFYVFAELQEPHVWANITQKNQVIFHDNDFEIFLDPDSDHHGYHEFEVNARGTIWELTLPKPYRDGGKPEDPDNIAGLVCKVHVDGTLNDPSDTDRGWSVEIAIPWTGLAAYNAGRAGPPADGDRWHLNFSRVEWLSDIIDSQYRKIPKTMRDEDNWAWSPIGVIDMHRPERWGVVQFIRDAHAKSATPDPLQATRDALVAVYYRQRSYHEQTGIYADSLAKLGLTDSLTAKIQLPASKDGYTATMPADGQEGVVMSIDQESHLLVPGAKK